MVTLRVAGFRPDPTALTLASRVRRIHGGRMGLGRRRGLRLTALGAVLAVAAMPAYADDPTPSTSEPPPASVTDVNRSLEQLQAEAAVVQADFAKATIAYTKALKDA